MQAYLLHGVRVEARGQFVESVFSLPLYVGSGDGTQVVHVVWQCHLLSHLTHPKLKWFCCCFFPLAPFVCVCGLGVCAHERRCPRRPGVSDISEVHWSWSYRTGSCQLLIWVGIENLSSASVCRAG